MNGRQVRNLPALFRAGGLAVPSSSAGGKPAIKIPDFDRPLGRPLTAHKRNATMPWLTAENWLFLSPWPSVPAAMHFFCVLSRVACGSGCVDVILVGILLSYRSNKGILERLGF